MGNKQVGHTSTIPSDTWPDWMMSIDGEMLISSLSIPGTRGSLNAYGAFEESQNWTLESQLEAGIRYLDLGCRLFHDMFPIHERARFQFVMVHTVLDVVEEFLIEHRSEVVIVRIRETHISEQNSKTFPEALSQLLKSNRYVYQDARSCGAVKLNDVRGKMIILHDYPDDHQIPGIPFNSIYKADVQYALTNEEEDLGKQWDSIRDHIDKASNEKLTKAFIVYCGQMPLSKVSPLPYVAASTVNKNLIDFLKGKKKLSENFDYRCGIIAMDFPWYELVELIIQSNQIEKTL